MIFKLLVIYLLLTRYVKLCISDRSIFIQIKQYAYTDTDDELAEYTRIKHIMLWKYK